MKIVREDEAFKIKGCCWRRAADEEKTALFVLCLPEDVRRNQYSMQLEVKDRGGPSASRRIWY